MSGEKGWESKVWQQIQEPASQPTGGETTRAAPSVREDSTLQPVTHNVTLTHFPKKQETGGSAFSFFVEKNRKKKKKKKQQF